MCVPHTVEDRCRSFIGNFILKRDDEVAILVALEKRCRRERKALLHRAQYAYITVFQAASAVAAVGGRRR